MESPDEQLMRVTCYMNMPSHYQATFYRELAKLCDLETIYSGRVPEERQALGWESDYDGYHSSTYKDLGIFEKFIPASGSFHLLAGLPGGLANLVRAISASSQVQMATQSEMPSPETATTQWRALARVYLHLLRMKRVPLLGIGKEIRDLARLTRFPDKLVFPFAYFPNPSLDFAADFLGPIIYSGQLVFRKGVDILVEAFSRSTTAKVRELVLIGDGDQRPALEQLTSRKGIEKRVHFLGAMKTFEALRTIASGSCLVLPSRFDGWGVVVNEAILLGVPVIVSNRCGSAELVEHGRCGFVFGSESVEGLRSSLDGLFESRQLWKEKSERALAYAPRLTAKAGAEYFSTIVRHVTSNYSGDKPLAPWLNHAS